MLFWLWMFSLLSAEQSEGQHKDKMITDQQKVIDNAWTFRESAMRSTPGITDTTGAGFAA
ncbi:MAG: hypothetical protein RR615_15775 [Morganella sp. (in: enterobacteria)]